ncbi:MAG: bifunctional (p)ppGpp synthetase/guanosine-3',5'-bis(diphosphate) 3'-pyrophosphohydrolase [Alphaproteobacteria bacterium]|nr:bifunctional (p)ppGpp synthetase/guanosine-3',5'-bis(diphosphate) 3'-pyrophosphohydrolase [Alphaproteobacteria bacterium]
MVKLNDLTDRITSYAPDADLELVTHAYLFAARAHKEQTRKSGEAYVTHPLEVALILADLKMDVDTIATALLHDTIEDTMHTREELSERFSPVIAEMVDGVSKIGKLQFRSKQEAAAENFRKMMLAMSRDIRVILVKLADRLHNMRTLGSMPAHKKVRIAQETLEIYAPLAARLGLMPLRCELEDLCFQHLHPEHYAELVQVMAESRPEREAYIQRVCAELQARLTGAGVVCTVSGRSKHLFSIYRKMTKSNLEFQQVHDLLAFRVLVDDLTQCYAALGYVHAFYRPVPDRIKDYIAMPKSNGYQSLHTTVIGPEMRRVEIQIRTYDMHRVSEYGIAAHWKYKEGHLALRREDMAHFGRLREVFETAREVEDPDEFMEAVKIDLFKNDVYVFTPAGDIKEFPLGATALDFAYAIHTEVGNRCVGAKVDGRMVPLRYELQSGDHVEILTSDNQHPRRDWLEFVKTGRALSRIRKYLRQEERETGVRIGREMLEGELKKHGSSIQALVRNGQIKRVLKERDVRDVETLLVGIAQGHVVLGPLVRELLPDKDWNTVDQSEADKSALARILERIRRPAESPVLISGEEDVLVSFARCCNPLPGEEVIGYVTRGRGITVHRRTCTQVLALEKERRIPVDWDGRVKTVAHASGIRVICVDRPGLLANITRTCTDAGVNISRANVSQINDAKAECDLEVGVASVDELINLIHRLEKIKGVISVDRLGA